MDDRDLLNRAALYLEACPLEGALDMATALRAASSRAVPPAERTPTDPAEIAAAIYGLSIRQAVEIAKWHDAHPDARVCHVCQTPGDIECGECGRVVARPSTEPPAPSDALTEARRSMEKVAGEPISAEDAKAFLDSFAEPPAGEAREPSEWANDAPPIVKAVRSCGGFVGEAATRESLVAGCMSPADAAKVIAFRDGLRGNVITEIERCAVAGLPLTLSVQEVRQVHSDLVRASPPPAGATGEAGAE